MPEEPVETINFEHHRAAKKIASYNMATIENLDVEDADKYIEFVTEAHNNITNHDVPVDLVRDYVAKLDGRFSEDEFGISKYDLMQRLYNAYKMAANAHIDNDYTLQKMVAFTEDDSVVSVYVEGYDECQDLEVVE
ncbi:hypothetical protein [Methanohalobium sp.]|uniref:hypothetical protein n=1 Tax=Methanohalobium sp. TaxID=2837493 RepID=UPI0025E38F8B|nr:hypothetical protein [Methanohalobium sp.]